LEKFQSNDNLESGKSSLKSPEESPSERAQENVARPQRAPRILVVDDSLDAQLILRDLLSKRGYEVISAPEAQTARDLLRSQHPDLIVLDIVMPGKSGYEFCHELKQDPLTKLIPIVIVTGLSERDDHIRAIEAGADDFLNKPVYPEELFARIKALLTTKEFMDNLENAEVVLVTLALGIESRDLYTGSHCRVVAHYASDFGHYVGLNEENIVALKRGGYLHDLGKVSVSDDILKKSSSLSPAEWEIMRQHPTTGESICRPFRVFNNVLPIIRHHHERWDGSGYPDQLSKHEIPLLAQIMGVVDVYDALRTARPYKTATGHEEAERIMMEETRHGLWNPDVIMPFFSMLKEKYRPAEG
jgi:putative two-component system response regulator